MANFLIPSAFSGFSTKDAAEFMSDVENSFNFRKLSNAEVKGCFPLLLREGAKYWFSALEDDDKEFFSSIRSAFNKQYIPRYAIDGGSSTGTAGESESLHSSCTEVHELCRLPLSPALEKRQPVKSRSSSVSPTDFVHIYVNTF